MAQLRMLLLSLCIIISLISMMVVATPPAQGKCKGGPVFTYKLVYQWPASYCLSITKPCIPNLPKEFTIHGLWAEDAGGNSVIYTIDKKKNPTPFPVQFPLGRGLDDELKLFWKSYDESSTNGILWEHEWNKHGVCMAFPSPYDYFLKVLKLHKTIEENHGKLVDVLEREGTNSGNYYGITKIPDNIFDSEGFKIEFACKESTAPTKDILAYEIRFCLSSQWELRNCSRFFRENSVCGKAARNARLLLFPDPPHLAKTEL